MNCKLCLMLFVSIAMVLVKSESTIEVDENGDEYEVKKFNIQGRQLNEGRSQCVVTRRKRSTHQQPPKPIYGQEGLNDERDDGDTMLATEQQNVFSYSPPTLNPTADADNVEEEVDEAEEGANTTGMHSIGNKNRVEKGNEEGEGDDGDDTSEVVHLPQLPILGQLQSDGESVAAIDTDGNGAHDSNTNGIVVIESHSPPKVNPQTHAVFALVPVNHPATDGTDEEDDAEDIIDDDFDLKEDINPVTTTAIWSTGDDSSNDLYDDLDEEPNKEHKVTKIIKKSLKTQKRMKPKRKNKNQLSTNKRRLPGSKNKRRNTIKRPNKTSLHRPIKKQKLRDGYNTRRGSPQSNRKQNKLSNNAAHNNKNFMAKKRKHKKHAEGIDQGTNTFTRTMTMTQSDDEDGDKYVNCIIIRKDPPPTTPRPFWDILGRDANGAPITSGHYGKRKRVNVRFVA